MFDNVVQIKNKLIVFNIKMCFAEVKKLVQYNKYFNYVGTLKKVL